MAESVLPEMTFKDFLMKAVPGTRALVNDLVRVSRTSPAYVFNLPQLSLYCSQCEGERYFSPGIAEIHAKNFADEIFTFSCKNCSVSSKKYAVLMVGKLDGRAAQVVKMGEYPIAEARLPNRLIKLVAQDRDLFLKGWSAERTGLGIGAFGYYRRVVDNQKDAILGAIAEAAEKLGDLSLAEEIRAAKAQSQFTSAVDQIKHALPDSLLIGGHNPLKVLYSALSDGLHNKDDAHCLEYAETVREVLTVLAERIAAVTKDDAKLRAQIGKLLNARG